MERIAVLTSGGDAPGMNAAIRAVVRCGIEAGMTVYGIERGYEGLIDGDFVEMDRRYVGDILQRGGTILKTARSSRFMTEEGIARAVRNLETFRIEALVVIGGDGSFAGALKLAEQHGIAVMGIPATIDNDLGYTDITIGFDTAVNTVLDAITRIRDTSSSHERTTVVEVMGRDCGDIALYSGMAGGAEIVLLPEIQTDMSEVCRKVLESVNSGKKHSVIVRAEGFYLSSREVVDIIRERTGRDVKLVVLSYIQRGGAPSFRDRMFATECGVKTIELLQSGIVNKAMGMSSGAVMGFDLKEALQVETVFQQELYDSLDVLSK
ncbi:MAG: 6-phosphofructokinase [Firmicutes bacterium]|nr:6-phosphofructokinase [Bacillota bacterium]